MNPFEDFKKDYRQDIAEIKNGLTNVDSKVNKVGDCVNGLHILIAENYVTRKEFDDYKRDQVVSKRYWAGYLISVLTILFTIVQIIINIWKKGP